MSYVVNPCYGVNLSYTLTYRGLKGLQLGVGAQRAPRLLVFHIFHIFHMTNSQTFAQRKSTFMTSDRVDGLAVEALRSQPACNLLQT